ncbi:hypothetical protein PENFLA_c011G07046 [Penicillium flavigenum]|uniref:C2H2-type domain-containing protein n=1 Tax=Penicillium flavigenum TaxID=254877 RepID=A0A1V6TA87_9EURO|nr:hypothetical protein PENFLA_c011G07046 [Penicillium flavigenum]
MAPDQSKQQTSRQPGRNTTKSKQICQRRTKFYGMEQVDWLRVQPWSHATEFLERWNQAYKHTHAHLISLDTDIPNTIQYWQFLEAVHSHPDLEQWYPDVDWESKEAISMDQSSNTPLRPTGEVSSFFASLRNEVEEYEGELLIVVNGWDGLTTDRMSFYNLFSHWAERITLRIYSQESIWQQKKFFEVNVTQVCSVFRGEIEFDIEELDNDFSLKDSTALFIRRFSAISLIKEDISVVSTELRALTNVRNEQPESRNLSKHICGDCNIPFPTSVDLNRHMHHKHEKHENPEMDLRCKFCGYLFSRKDHRDRHVKETCPQNRPKQTLACEIVIDTPCLLKEEPTVARECSAGLQVPPPDQQTLAKQEPPAKKLKRCRRGSKIRFLPPEALPKGSDNGILSYYQLTERHARHLPRLELNPENLNGMEKDIVYKGELFCRYPKCEHFKRYSQPTKLRTHYEQSHRFRYQASSPGHLNKFGEHLHAEGIEWLARWAQLGQDEAGERPIPTRK